MTHPAPITLNHHHNTNCTNACFHTVIGAIRISLNGLAFENHTFNQWFSIGIRQIGERGERFGEEH